MLRAMIVVVLLCVGVSSAQMGGGLANLLGLLGGNKGGAGGLLSGGAGALLGGGGGGRLGDALAGGGPLGELLKPVLEQLGVDSADIQAGVEENDRAKRFRDNIIEAKEECSAKGYSHSTFGQKCSSTTFMEYIEEEITGGEGTFHMMFEGPSTGFAHIRQAVLLCQARMTADYFSWKDITEYLDTTVGRREASRTNCLNLITREKAMCSLAKKLMCSFVHGEPLECRHSSEINPFNHGTRYQPMKAHTRAVKQPITSVYDVAGADFQKSIAHARTCDKVSRVIENKAILEAKRAEEERQRERDRQAALNAEAQADVAVSADLDGSYEGDDDGSLAGRLADALLAGSSDGRARGN